MRLGHPQEFGTGTGLQFDPQSVEERLVAHRASQPTQAFRERAGQPMHLFGNRPQAVGTMIDGVHRRDVRQERLGRADVAGRLLPSDMLFPRLERQAERRAAAGILGNANQSTGKVPLERITGGKVSRMRPTVAQRHPKSLRAADRDIRPKRARWRQEHQAQRIRRHHHQRTGGMCRLDEGTPVGDGAVSVRILNQRTEDRAIELEVLRPADHDLDPQRQRPGAEQLDVLRMTSIRNQESRPVLGVFDAMAHGHGLGCRRRLVEQRGVGHRQAGQISDQGLERKQPFEPALGDFGLIGVYWVYQPGFSRRFR